ncbi:MAG: hypothetical protein KDC38_00875 [Planctomycetes bacterium]|nr:hypothetical protein [Planctomycetota bacterium]
MAFPTTLWTTIREAGARDPMALQRFVERYRSPVLEYLVRHGYSEHDAEDVCHDVLVRVIDQGVLSKADHDRGRFRSLLLRVTQRTIQDRRRKRVAVPVGDFRPSDLPIEAGDDRIFDEVWALGLAERALVRLREQGSRYYPVLCDHLRGRPVDRNRLWIARGKLVNLIRREVANTCSSTEDFEEEWAHLARYLRPRNLESD